MIKKIDVFAAKKKVGTLAFTSVIYICPAQNTSLEIGFEILVFQIPH